MNWGFPDWTGQVWRGATGKVQNTYEEQEGCEAEEEDQRTGEVSVIHYPGIYPFKRIENGQRFAPDVRKVDSEL